MCDIGSDWQLWFAKILCWQYEGHEAKIDPQNAARHRLEEEIAGGLGVGAAGVGLYGHHKKENSEEQLEELETGHKKHGWFG